MQEPSPGIPSPGIQLSRTDENADEIEALAALLGGRVGLEAMLGDLDRQGRRALAPGRAVHRSWTWDRHDRRDPRWWPQGVSTSADASDDEVVAGRRVIAVAWYAKELPGDPGNHGSRVTFFDLGTRRYRHVLLVVPVLRDGVLGLEPLRVHAGGIVWHAGHLHVAATAKGFMTCRLEDLLRIPAPAAGDAGRLGIADGRVSAYGYEYVLPVRLAYRAVTAPGEERLRYSFLSLDRSGEAPALTVGEYGNSRQTRRLASFPLDPATGLLAEGDGGVTLPVRLEDADVTRMQGAVVARDRLHLTTSHGPWTPGSVHTGEPGAFRRFRWATPMGPEDITYWPSTDLLYSVSEHPRRRWMFSMRRSRFD